MTREDFQDLRPGDVVRGKAFSQVYIVTANYGDRVTAVRTADLTNPPEWDLVAKTRQITPGGCDAAM